MLFVKLLFVVIIFPIVRLYCHATLKLSLFIEKNFFHHCFLRIISRLSKLLPQITLHEHNFTPLNRIKYFPRIYIWIRQLLNQVTPYKNVNIEKEIIIQNKSFSWSTTCLCNSGHDTWDNYKSNYKNIHEKYTAKI